MSKFYALSGARAAYLCAGPHQLEAVAAGHLVVGDDQVEDLFLDRLQRDETVPGLDHLVAGIAERIETAHLNVRLVVLGTLEIPVRTARLTVTGPYKREDLPDLIEAHGINMFLFPSIWPETFSYVVAEMTALKLPVVAFDLGAPAERLRSYGLARLCGEVGVESALETMLAFHRELAMGESEAA